MTTFLCPSRGQGDHTMGSHRKEGCLKKHLTDAGIANALNYSKAFPFYAAYGYLAHVPEDFPVAYSNQSRILSFPIYPEMTEEMVAYVAEVIGSFSEKSETPLGQFLNW